MEFKHLPILIKTAYHKSENKVELSESEYQEGILHVNIANETLNKFKIKRYMKLLAAGFKSKTRSKSLQ